MREISVEADRFGYGLVHLLEKGHAKVGGGRTRAFPHMAPGYDEGAPAFEKKLLEGVDRVLGS